MPQKKVLIVEDDGPRRRSYIHELQQADLDQKKMEVIGAADIPAALELIADDPDISVVVIDLQLEWRDPGYPELLAKLGGQSGQLEGEVLARHLRANPKTKKINTLAMTSALSEASDKCKEFFRGAGDPSKSQGVYDKQTHWFLLKHHVSLLVGLPSTVKVFIVHGHDHQLRDQAYHYCRNELRWEAKCLDPQAGTHWIETFEEHAGEAWLAWILASDDEWGAPRDPKPEFPAERRPRPNVLLEYGYFLGRFGRRTNRVFLFQRPNVKMGSDIDGVAVIPVPGDVAEHDALIRQHHRAWLL